MRVLGVIAAFFLYICWLGWPSLFPMGEGPDIVHHLTLIHFIQHYGTLPHDPLLGAWLGEMNNYPPGSHLMAAGLADLLGVDAVRVVHPLIALFVGLKAGLTFVVLLRLLRSSTAAVAAALAGTLLLLVPHAYLLQSITWFGFYSQVIAETFAMAMVWAAVAWHETPSARMAAIFALFGVAVVLCWPVLMGPPALAMVVVVLTRSSLPSFVRGRHLAIALLPIAATVAAYSATHRAGAGVLSSGGSVLTPSVSLFGWPFLLLAGAGIVVAVRRAGTFLPLLAFGGACAAQVLALIALQAHLRATNFYLAFKTVHLLVYALVMFAALALDVIARGLPGRRRAWAWAVPIAALAWVSRTDLPRRPLPSPMTEPTYRAGRWAHAHVPPQCVDYLVDHWLTGYWLHLDILGNARASERMRRERFDEKTTVGRWIEGTGLPFAIVGNLDSLPRDLRSQLRILQRFGPAAVVTRADGAGLCTDDTPTLDQFMERGSQP